MEDNLLGPGVESEGVVRKVAEDFKSCDPGATRPGQ